MSEIGCERLRLAAWKAALGVAAPESLPSLAAAALAGGCDSPSLRTLAGLTDKDTDEARALFGKALIELDFPHFGARDALLALARDIATKVLDGSTTPNDAATEIWDLSLRLPGERLPQLDTFIYAASEWEDRPQDRELFSQGIIAAARGLLQS